MKTKIKGCGLFIILTSHGIIFIDSNKKWFLGGSNYLVKPALFKTLKLANKFVQKIRNDNRSNKLKSPCGIKISWFRILECTKLSEEK